MQSESFVITNREEMLPVEVLKQYALKESKGIQEEGEFPNFVQPPYNPRQMLGLLELNTYHQRSCDVIGRDVSGDAFDLVSTDEDYDTGREELLNLFNKININDLIYKLQYDAQSIGFGLLEVVRENGRDSPVSEINHFSPVSFERHSDGIRAKQTVGTKTQWFVILGKNKDSRGRIFDVNCNTGEISYKKLPETERANELIWINRYSPKTSLYGVSPVVSAVSSIYGDHYSARYNNEFFKNYGMPSYAVKILGDFDPGVTDPSDPDYDVTKTLKYKIQNAIKETIKNPHSAFVLQIPSEDGSNVNVDIQPLSTDVKEASFTVYREMNRDEIISAHGVDPSRLGIAKQGVLNGSNAKQLDTAYKSSLILPYRREICDIISTQIIKNIFGYNYEFTIIDSDSKRNTEDIDNTIKLVNAGILTINEAREYLGKLFNITAKDDICLDEHYFSGRSLTSAGFDNTMFENPFGDTDETRSESSDQE